MKKRKVIITAGGTGGHLFPAQALAEQLQKRANSPSILFIAGGLTTNRCFDRTRFLFEEIPSAPLFSKNPLKLFKGLYHLTQGTRKAITLLKAEKPDVVVGFGSYYTAPVLMAAKWLNIPIIIHEANSIPGRANKILSHFASCIALHFPHSQSYFSGKTEVVGLPLREKFLIKTISKEAAKKHYGLSPLKKTLLVCGGSQGAVAINSAIVEAAQTLASLSLQVIHLTGDSASVETIHETYKKHHVNASVKSFEPDMHLAWTACDFFLGRSGASTIAESLECEVPGILIPYPFATNNHQETNANFLVSEVGSCVKILQNTLTPKLLSQELSQFCSDESLIKKKSSIQSYKEKVSHRHLEDIVESYYKESL